MTLAMDSAKEIEMTSTETQDDYDATETQDDYDPWQWYNARARALEIAKMAGRLMALTDLDHDEIMRAIGHLESAATILEAEAASYLGT